MSTAPDKLTEALVGLCVLAAKGGMTDAEIRRLVEQFRKNYPEVSLASDVVTLRGAMDRVSKALNSIKPGSYATLDGALDAIADLVNDDQVYLAWKGA